VIPHVTGLLVPVRDPVALAEALRLLINDLDLCKKMGAAGRLHVEHHFSLPLTVSLTIGAVNAVATAR
jgi:glycosyltransferase involved in cell wall biosynthesis